MGKCKETNKMSRYKKYKQTYQAYYQKNRERILQLQRQWLQTHKRKRDPEECVRFQREWRSKYPEKNRAKKLLQRHPDKYPLGKECEFCGKSEKLEHGHIDYDYPELYLTVCHQCNAWMDKPQ